jgi:hypothetical protein
MPVKVVWDNNEKITVRWDMDTKWTWEEFDRAVDETSVLMDSVTNQVDVLVLSKKSLPPTPNVLPHFVRSQTYPIANDNGGYLVIVGFWQSGVIASAMRIVETVAPKGEKVFKGVRFFDSEAEARVFLAG